MDTRSNVLKKVGLLNELVWKAGQGFIREKLDLLEPAALLLTTGEIDFPPTREQAILDDAALDFPPNLGCGFGTIGIETPRSTQQAPWEPWVSSATAFVAAMQGAAAHWLTDPLINFPDEWEALFETFVPFGRRSWPKGGGPRYRRDAYRPGYLTGKPLGLDTWRTDLAAFIDDLANFVAAATAPDVRAVITDEQDYVHDINTCDVDWQWTVRRHAEVIVGAETAYDYSVAQWDAWMGPIFDMRADLPPGFFDRIYDGRRYVDHGWREFTSGSQSERRGP